MKRITALELRQSLGKVIEQLVQTGEPLLLEKGRKPVAVLISLRDFHERFVEKSAAEARDAILREIDAIATDSVHKTPAVEVLQELRGRG